MVDNKVVNYYIKVVNIRSAEMRERTKQIRDFILENVKDHPKDIAAFTAKHFDISRQAVNKHLKAMVDNKYLAADGTRNSRVYSVLLDNKFNKSYQLPGIDESMIYLDDIYPKIRHLEKNVVEIVEYVFTEIMNNANDHSEGNRVFVGFEEREHHVFFSILDDGIGIFKKIADKLNLPDEKLAILELDKGKFTTDPENHSGEGIFFSVKVSDSFSIFSGENHFMHSIGTKHEDYLFDTDFREGTIVLIEINKKSKKTLKAVFDKYSDDEYGFTKTVVNVELLRIGNENLISRSQAKRLIARFEQFKHVVLDFTNVDMIGQAFADEVFRVFQRRYPDIVLEPVNTTFDVDKMISRAKVKLREMENS